jgi:uncharacterized protein YndB with AHSA1/START domain
MRRPVFLLSILAFATAAQADLKQSAPDGFIVQHRYDIQAKPADAWIALGMPGQWWPKDHTWSGDAKNLSIKLDAGACFCERWKGGSAEHGRVVFVENEKTLRIAGALGPLQNMAVSAVLEIALKPSEEGTEATVTYRVSGTDAHGFDKFAAKVDEVVGQQFGAWAGYASKKPEPAR